MVPSPAPLILAPQEFRKSARSAISGSLAQFSKTVVPFATDAASIAFSVAPTDGIVIYADPLADSANSGFRFRQVIDLNRISLPLTEENQHEITKNVIADNITVSRYTQVISLEDNYETLMPSRALQ